MRVRPHDQNSTIAELVFTSTPVINFARLVADLDTVLDRFQGADRQLTWDCEDVAMFDLPGTRILLAYIETPRAGIESCLTIAVGPSSRDAEDKPKMKQISHATLCAKLVQQVCERAPADSTIWHDYAGIVTPDVIDELVQELPGAPVDQNPAHPIYARVDRHDVDDLLSRFTMNADSAKSARSRAKSEAKAGLETTNGKVDSTIPPLQRRKSRPRNRNTELVRVRDALYLPEDGIPKAPRASTQLRIATHTMNTTLIIVALPVGAAMLTYSVLRGESMRATTAAMVVTGFSTALLRTDIAQNILSLVSI